MNSAPVDSARTTRIERPEPRAPTRVSETVRAPEKAPQPTRSIEAAEVRISDEARALREAQRQPNKSAAPRATEPKLDGRSQETLVESAPVLAVRTGPAPIQTFVKDPETLVREAMSKRSGVTDVSAVLKQVDRRTSEEIELIGDGHGEAQETAPLPLMGEGRSSPEVPTRKLPGAGPAAQLPAPAPAVETRQLEHRTETVERAEAERGSDQAELEDVSRMVSQTGSVRSQDVDPRSDAARVELMGDSSAPAGEKIAHRTLTQAGAVEARAESDIVSRVFEGTSKDPGPTPRNEENLSSRSVPISTYA